MMLLLKVGNQSDVATPPMDFPKCGDILTPVNDTE